jgi:hypothetical protein
LEILESVSVVSAPKGGLWNARLIEANVRGSSAYYPAAALERSVGKFAKGTHVYANHLSLTEKEDRPEGDVNNLIGELAENASFKPDGLYAPIKIYSDKREWLMERANAIGLSIRAEGAVEESNGVPTLVEISKVHSVDVVTRAGAGGKFVSIMESARLNESEGEQLSEHKKEETEVELPKEFLAALDSLTESMKSLDESLKADRDAKAAAKALAEAEANKPKELDAADVADALVEAGLTGTARARVLAAVKGGADLAESIKAEETIKAEYLAEAAKNAGGGNIEDAGGSKLSESERSLALAKGVFDF